MAAALARIRPVLHSRAWRKATDFEVVALRLEVVIRDVGLRGRALRAPGFARYVLQPHHAPEGRGSGDITHACDPTSVPSRCTCCSRSPSGSGSSFHLPVLREADPHLPNAQSMTARRHYFADLCDRCHDANEREPSPARR